MPLTPIMKKFKESQSINKPFQFFSLLTNFKAMAI